MVGVSAGSPAARAAAATAFASWRSAAGHSDDRAALIVAALEGAILLARAEDDPAVVERIGAALDDLLA